LVQSGAFHHWAAVNHQLRWPFARGDGDLPLPKPVRSAILASKRPRIWRMSEQTTETGDATAFYGRVGGTLPGFYDRGLGPVFFADFADDIARRTAAFAPLRVLETAAGTGIVTRRPRDILPAAAQVTASDLNAPMLDFAREKFGSGEHVRFEHADATMLPFPDAGFDAVVCQFGLMFFPDKDKAFREAHRVLAAGGRYLFSVWDSQRHNPIGPLRARLPPAFFQPIRRVFSTHRFPIIASIRSRMVSKPPASPTSASQC
jgi:SAM-dependent methyltransferase